MKNRVGIVAIVVDNPKLSADKVNELLSAYSDIIIGRMGLPYKERRISFISVMVDGTSDRIAALCGKLGRVEGVNVKSVLTQTGEEDK